MTSQKKPTDNIIKPTKHNATPTATQCNTNSNTMQNQQHNNATPTAQQCNINSNTMQHQQQNHATPT
eukprot:5752418-Heterocapsa_arctica.AAC.1